MNLNISIYKISLNLVTWLYDGGLLTKMLFFIGRRQSTIPVGHLSYYTTMVLILPGRAVKAMWCGKATSS